MKARPLPDSSLRFHSYVLLLQSPPQISKTSQEFVALQQKLNEIIQAHQSNPENNGMFVRGKVANGYTPQNHKSSKIAAIGSEAVNVMRGVAVN